MLSFFPRDVLVEIWDLIESVSEGFPSYSLKEKLAINHCAVGEGWEMALRGAMHQKADTTDEEDLKETFLPLKVGRKILETETDSVKSKISSK